jgi:hypothetical protein
MMWLIEGGFTPRFLKSGLTFGYLHFAIFSSVDENPDGKIGQGPFP